MVTIVASEDDTTLTFEPDQGSHVRPGARATHDHDPLPQRSPGGPRHARGPRRGGPERARSIAHDRPWPV